MPVSTSMDPVRREQPIAMSRADGDGMIAGLRYQTSQGRYPGPQHLHGMTGRRQLFPHREDGGGRHAQRFEIRLYAASSERFGHFSCTTNGPISSNSQLSRDIEES